MNTENVFKVWIKFNLLKCYLELQTIGNSSFDFFNGQINRKWKNKGGTKLVYCCIVLVPPLCYEIKIKENYIENNIFTEQDYLRIAVISK